MSSGKYSNYLKLVVIGILLVWLFLKSPLNPLYQDFSSPEMFAVYFSFTYWLLVSFFLLWLLFFVNKHNYEKNLTRILLFTTSLWYLFFIPYGYEATDTGYHLSKQWGMYHGLWKENFDAITGTNMIGGLWLMIIGKPMLLWARLGFVILQTAIVYYTFKILLLFFKPSKVLIITILSTVLISYFQYYHTINYDNLPYLFMLISLYYTLAVIFRDDTRDVALIYTGLLSVLAVFCKLTFIPALILPFLILFSYKNTVSKGKCLQFSIKYCYGLLSGILIILLFSAVTGGLAGYIDFLATMLRDFVNKKDPIERSLALRDHSFSVLTKRYLITLFSVLINAVISLSVIVIAGFTIKKYSRIKIIPIIVVVLFGWFFYYRVFIYEGSAANLPGGIISFYTALALFWVIFNKTFDRKMFYLLFIVVSVFIISFLGSDLGIATAFRVGSNIFFIAFISILLIENFHSKYFDITPIVYSIFLLFLIFLVAKDYRPYRDLKFSEAQVSFNSNQLYGIKSNIERVVVVDSLLSYINNIPNFPQKKVFFTKSNPMLYYLTNTNYCLKSPWDTINSYEDLKNNLLTNPPDIIVNSIHSHRDAIWPFVNIKWLKENTYEYRARRYYEFYEQFITENNYVEVYKNSFYTVYSEEIGGLINE